MVRIRRSAIAGHLDPQFAPIKHGSVHGVHGVLGVALVVETHERESATLLGVAIAGNVDIPHAAVLLEDAAKCVWRSTVCQVVHLQGGHAFYVWRRPPVTHGVGLKKTEKSGADELALRI